MIQGHILVHQTDYAPTRQYHSRMLIHPSLYTGAFSTISLHYRRIFTCPEPCGPMPWNLVGPPLPVSDKTLGAYSPLLIWFLQICHFIVVLRPFLTYFLDFLVSSFPWLPPFFHLTGTVPWNQLSYQCALSLVVILEIYALWHLHH